MAYENQFSVRVVNPLEALMVGEQGYKEMSNSRALDDASAAIRSGDNKALMDALLRAKQIGPAIEIAKLGRQQEASNQFSNDMAGLWGGGQTQPTTSVPSPSPPPSPYTAPAPTGSPLVRLMNDDGTTAPPRAPVMPSAKVWGDQEAIDKGLYDAPKPVRVAQAAPTDVSNGSGADAQPGGRATGAQINGVQLDKAVPMLMKAATNPYLPKEQQELAKMLIGKAIDQYPTEIRQLEIFQQRPDLFQKYIQIKQAGATAITNDMRGENEESKAFGKNAGERGGKMFEAAGAAPKKLQTLDRMENMLDQVRQGKIEPARMTVSAWAKSFGLDDSVAERIGLDPKNVGTAQAIEALSNELTLGNIGPGGLPANNFSNTDRAFVNEIVPKLGNDEVGNKIKIEAARRLAKLDVEKAREWQAFRRDTSNKGRGFDDFEVAWNDKITGRDLFGDLVQKARGSVQQGATQPPAGLPPDAQQGKDGKFYGPDPNRPGKYLRYD